jgi:hypothetical protein
MNNYPPNYEVEDTTEDLHALAGLVDVGLDEDGEVEWQGSREQWKKFEQLNDE